jgi:hypothetical protein
MYPTNTTHVQKEGDTMTFLYLVPTGMNDPAQPTWGSWGGRYGLSEEFRSHPYYWANQADQWNGVTHRDNTVARWAVHLQNDFKARMDWCVTDSSGANHPPRTRVSGAMVRFAVTGEEITLDAGESSDPDRNTLSFDWFFYPEAGGYKGTYPMLRGANQSRASFIAPRVDDSQTIHVVLALTDNGEPALTRYQRVIVTLKPSE